ncbi:MAG TPA: response regulator transcription factor [Cyclobacteriaceae bacterium]|nr:response regulator transcription factor [Cyclobacteriaceae bacterium]
MSTAPNIRVAIAEDNAFALKVILEKLASDSTITVCATANNGVELVEKLRDSGRVDVILMDIEMPRQDGIKTTELVKKEFPHIKILMLTIFDDDEPIFQSIMAGADGYLLKEERAAKIIQCIREVMEGGAGMSAGIAARVLRMVQQGGPAKRLASPESFDLTTRELEILSQLKTGLSYEKIAENLFISYGTVRKHIENVYRKLQVHNKVEAVQKAVRENLV